MLYVTTRNSRDTFTTQRALRENRGPDGGMYLPFRAPCFSQAELDDQAEKPFAQRMAEILNLLFQTRLSGWDVDFCAGRYPVRLESLRHRVVMAEIWHNSEWDFDRTVRNLTARLQDGEIGEPGGWARIAVRIAVLFGIFGELRHAGVNQPVDIAMVSGDFSAPISAWYARQWGLPIGNLVCCCNENNSLWDLICHGQLRTDVLSIPTAIPEADVALPEDLERLIFECGGTLEVRRYLDACRQGSIYCPNDAVLAQLRKGLYVSVVSSQRMETTIPSVYRTHGYILAPSAALAYAGMQDYRAKTGQTGPCLVLAEKGPLHNAEAVASMLGISTEELKNQI
ncbi:MAG: hypothetical protein ACI4PH_11590 [Faecousia sp.]